MEPITVVVNPVTVNAIAFGAALLLLCIGALLAFGGVINSSGR